MEKKTMSVTELSNVLGVSLPKAYELVNTGVIGSVRVGTRILIPIENVNEFLHSNKEAK